MQPTANIKDKRSTADNDMFVTNHAAHVTTSDNGHVCTDNSFEETLAIDEVKTGAWQDTLNYNNIIIGIKSTQDSTIDGLDVQWSHNGLHIDDNDYFTISANKGKVFTFTPARRYVRVVYTNDGIEADVNIQTIFKKGGIKASSHRIQDSIVAEDDAELVKSVLTGQDENGVFQNVQTTVDGDLTISDNSDGLAIAKGLVTGHTYVHKFGSAPDFDTADGRVSIWDGAEDGETWTQMEYQYSTTADIQYLSSNNASDDQLIQIQGLDADYNLVTQTATLNGTASVTIDTPLIRVFRMKNANSTDLAGHVFLATSAGGGVPTSTDIRCIVQPTNNQTEMALYTVPAGKTAYLRSWYSSSAGANKDTNIIIRLKARQSTGVWQLKHKMAWNGDFPYQHTYVEPEKFTEKVDIEMTAELTATGVTGAAVSAGFDIVLVDN